MAELTIEEKQALHENRRDVMLGQVFVNMGIGQTGEVFPTGLPSTLPAPGSMTDHPRTTLSMGWGLVARVQKMFGIREEKIVERIVTEGKAELPPFPTAVDMKDVGSQPRVNFGN
eukprot:TRINITY_DN22110_c0_g1_i3.p1 TRINITY_DN22110_c0_g1~~TRINITY_DN22110_c0_g1_i3.p1  ORF type:complete len:131 (+),score=22.85 TRINITY_DN22110_c0_g1_i3:50-394(+)